MTKIKNNVLLVSSSEFGLGRAKYIAITLLKLGYDVVILSNKAFYSTSKDYQEQIYKNDDDKMKKIKTVYFPSLLLLYNSVIGRLIIYSWMTAWSFFYMIRNMYSIDIIFFRPPHPFTDLAGVLFKTINKKVMILSDITDLWPDALKYVTLNKFIKRALIVIGDAINDIIYRHLDVIITHNELMAEILENRSHRPVHVLYGVIDLERFSPIEKGAIFPPKQVSEFVKEKFVALYAGLLGPFQNPYLLISLAETLSKMNIKDIVVLVIGDGPLRNDLERRAKKSSLGNIMFVGRVPHEEMPHFYNLADVCLLFYASLDFLAIGLPKKFIEYTACGKPVICASPPCVASSLSLTHGAGFHVKPSSEGISQMIEIILKLKNDDELRNITARNSRRMAQYLFSIENAENVLESIIENIEFKKLVKK